MDLPPLELDGEDAAVYLAPPDVGKPRQHAKHRPVVGQDVGREPAEVTRLRRGEESVEQEAAQAAPLPGVFDDDGDLGETGRLAGLVARCWER